MKELYKRYRPKNLDTIIGQDQAIDKITKWLKYKSLPHTLLFTGPSGVGKTTIARILRKELECRKADYQELNTADARGIDKVREIRSRMMTAPMTGACRIWLLDEVHKWTTDSQHAMLKILEDTPSHVYFFLATTNPEKLIRTIITRCSQIGLKSLSDADISKLLLKISKTEKKKIPKEVIEKIIDNSFGSARQALVFLHGIINLNGKTEMLNAIQSETLESQAENIVKILFRKNTTWKQIARALQECKKEEPEQLRWAILEYARKVLLGGGGMAGRAYLIINAFRDNFYDSKHAGLAAACYEVLADK